MCLTASSVCSSATVSKAGKSGTYTVFSIVAEDEEGRRDENRLAQPTLARELFLRDVPDCCPSVSCILPASKSSSAIFRAISISVRFRQINHATMVNPVSGTIETRRIHHCEAARKAVPASPGPEATFSWENRFVPSMPCRVMINKFTVMRKGRCSHRRKYPAKRPWSRWRWPSLKRFRA
jgi:hypothetical protein